MNKQFVKPGSIVRHIWSEEDMILFIFAGASAEFALHTSVDWLYFTGKLPKDPLGRMLSTVHYAKQIVFTSDEKARKTISYIRSIHSKVEESRHDKIPDWAYRDVLDMLIDYSIRSFEYIDRPLKLDEKEEIVKVFCEVGLGMGLLNLPSNFETWEIARKNTLEKNFRISNYTHDLFKQYKNHLGCIRYLLLKQIQSVLLPQTLAKKLRLNSSKWIGAIIKFYKYCKYLHVESRLVSMLLPTQFKLK